MFKLHKAVKSIILNISKVQRLQRLEKLQRLINLYILSTIPLVDSMMCGKRITTSFKLLNFNLVNLLIDFTRRDNGATHEWNLNGRSPVSNRNNPILATF